MKKTIMCALIVAGISLSAAAAPSSDCVHDLMELLSIFRRAAAEVRQCAARRDCVHRIRADIDLQIPP